MTFLALACVWKKSGNEGGNDGESFHHGIVIGNLRQ